MCGSRRWGARWCRTTSACGGRWRRSSPRGHGRGRSATGCGASARRWSASGWWTAARWTRASSASTAVSLGSTACSRGSWNPSSVTSRTRSGGTPPDRNGIRMATTHDIVQKLWNLCHVLRDDGITYHQYVTELTYLLFLKMAEETKTEGRLPEGFRWRELVAADGVEQLAFYRRLLLELGSHADKRVEAIYA